jgi:hypothetical protein
MESLVRVLCGGGLLVLVCLVVLGCRVRLLAAYIPAYRRKEEKEREERAVYCPEERAVPPLGCISRRCAVW